MLSAWPITGQSAVFAWCDEHQLGGIADIEPLHVAAYIEAMQSGSKSRRSSSTRRDPHTVRLVVMARSSPPIRALRTRPNYVVKTARPRCLMPKGA